MKPHLPTIPEIIAAARASAQKTPRPGAAFWREAIRCFIDAPQYRDIAADVLAFERNWTSADASHGAKVCALLDRLDGAHGALPLPEADLRAVFVELQILASDDEADARRRWGAVFALGLEEG